MSEMPVKCPNCTTTNPRSRGAEVISCTRCHACLYHCPKCDLWCLNYGGRPEDTVACSNCGAPFRPKLPTPPTPPKATRSPEKTCAGCGRPAKNTQLTGVLWCTWCEGRADRQVSKPDTCGRCGHPTLLVGSLWCSWCNAETWKAPTPPDHRVDDPEITGTQTGKGHVYVFVNSSMPGKVKVGKTRKDPTARAAELSGTGVPVPFVVAYSVLVSDCDEVERLVHARLAASRVNEKREFFKVSSQEAIDVLLEIAERFLTQ